MDSIMMMRYLAMYKYFNYFSIVHHYYCIAISVVAIYYVLVGKVVSNRHYKFAGVFT